MANLVCGGVFDAGAGADTGAGAGTDVRADAGSGADVAAESDADDGVDVGADDSDARAEAENGAGARLASRSWTKALHELGGLWLLQ